MAQASAPNPQYSVIMPVYNCRPWIREAVQSVLAQTAPNFELIVVDDCSTDGSADAIADLIGEDERIRLITSTIKGNAASARNTGLEASHGRLIAFLDADDLWLPDRLSSHLRVFETYPDSEMVFSDFRGFGGSQGEEPPHLISERNLPRVAASHLDGPFGLPDTELEIYKCRDTLSTFMFLNYNLLFMHSITLSRQALNAQPYWFPTNLTVCEDFEFFLRVLENGRTVFLPEVLAWYRRRPQSLTNQEEQYLRGVIEFHTANLDRVRARLATHEVRSYKFRISQFRASLAWQLKLRGAIAQSRQQYLLAFLFCPSAGVAKMLARSLVPTRIKSFLTREQH